jgi:hypothetical protein
MSWQRFLYAIVPLVLLMDTIAAAPAAQSSGATVAQLLAAAAASAGYSINPSQIQTVTLPNNGGSVASYALVASVDASNSPTPGVLVALQYWNSSGLTGFVLVNLTSVSQQQWQFTLLNSANNVVGTQTVPTSAGTNQNAVRRGIIVVTVTLCVTAFGYTVCISWTVIIVTPVAPPPPPVLPPPVAPQPVPINNNQVAAN